MSRKSEILYEAMANIDDDLIASASVTSDVKKRKSFPIKWISVAACLVLMAGVGVAAWKSGILNPADVVSKPDDGPKVSDSVTEPPESTVNTEENVDPADENTTDVSDTEVPEDVGGSGFIIENYSYYPAVFMGVDLGWTDSEGCFIYDRAEEVDEIIYELDSLRKEYPYGYGRALFLYGNMIWHLVQRLDLTREDVEIYSELSHCNFSDEQIDALFIEDEVEARKALRREDVFFSELTGELYTVYEIRNMDQQEFDAIGISDEEIERVCEYLDEYLPENIRHYEGSYQIYANEIRRLAGLPEEDNQIDIYGRDSVTQ